VRGARHRLRAGALGDGLNCGSIPAPKCRTSLSGHALAVWSARRFTFTMRPSRNLPLQHVPKEAAADIGHDDGPVAQLD
jgi:hypothetical protein